jgi:hypothetical protein
MDATTHSIASSQRVWQLPRTAAFPGAFQTAAMKPSIGTLCGPVASRPLCKQCCKSMPGVRTCLSQHGALKRVQHVYPALHHCQQPLAIQAEPNDAKHRRAVAFISHLQ